MSTHHKAVASFKSHVNTRLKLNEYLSFILISAMVLVPLLALIYGALRSKSPGSPKAIYTLKNLESVYGGLFSGGWTQSVTINSLGLAIPVMLVSCAIGIFLAWSVVRTDIPARKTLSALFLIPMLYSPLVGVIGWVVLADPNAGLINAAWSFLTGSNEALLDIYSFAGIVWVMIFYFTPYAFVLNVGIFKSMDPSIEEAASVAGANLWQRLKFVTFPIMLGGIASCALFIFTLALEQFAIPGFLGSHIHLETLAYSIFVRTNTYPIDLPSAAAAGTLLMLLASVGLYFYKKSTKHSERYITVTARGFKSGLTHLGQLRWVVLGICASIFFLGTFLPLAAVALRALMPVRTTALDLTSLNFNNFTTLLDSQDILIGLKNSVLLGVTTACICAILGLWMSFQIIRRKSRLMSAAEYLISLPIGIPGTVFGIGMVWAYVGTPLYLTLWILLLAFVTRYFIYGVRMIGNGLSQIDRVLEEAAQVSGANTVQGFWLVNLPLLKPVLSSMWLLVFMIVMREVSASVILYGVDSVTLPILTWTYLFDGNYGTASALSILQLVIVALIVAIFRLALDAKLNSQAVE
jgi:iron(III) transport system permease protein